MTGFVNYIVDLSRKEFEAIGFIPDTALRKYVERNQVLLEEENDEPCGFLVFGNGWPKLRVYQACIQYDARRREHGLSLVARLEAVAVGRGCEAITLWCAEGLAANEFWRACGFSLAAVKATGSTRGRLLNLWEKPLPNPIQPVLYHAGRWINYNNLLPKRHANPFRDAVKLACQKLDVIEERVVAESPQLVTGEKT